MTLLFNFLFILFLIPRNSLLRFLQRKKDFIVPLKNRFTGLNNTELTLTSEGSIPGEQRITTNNNTTKKAVIFADSMTKRIDVKNRGGSMVLQLLQLQQSNFHGYDFIISKETIITQNELSVDRS